MLPPHVIIDLQPEISPVTEPSPLISPPLNSIESLPNSTMPRAYLNRILLLLIPPLFPEPKDTGTMGFLVENPTHLRASPHEIGGIGEANPSLPS
jgi:hypothetical protein